MGRENRPTTRRGLCNQAAGETQSECDALLDITERCGMSAPASHVDFNRVFIDEPSRRVHAIDSQIHEWPTTGDIQVYQPWKRDSRNIELAEGTLDHVNAAKAEVLYQPLYVERTGFEVFSIGGH